MSELSVQQRVEIGKKQEQWLAYIKYLVEWAFDHYSPGFYGNSPAGFDEFLDNDYHGEVD